VGCVGLWMIRRGLCWAVVDMAGVSDVDNANSLQSDGMLRAETGLQRAALPAEMLPSPLVLLALAWRRG
jgi:hypothetical protein